MIFLDAADHSHPDLAFPCVRVTFACEIPKTSVGILIPHARRQKLGVTPRNQRFGLLENNPRGWWRPTWVSGIRERRGADPRSLDLQRKRSRCQEGASCKCFL
ncbi:hypothetical protein NL676_037745 [Syzygium grande]|nr:hypothetical protein NL676_037745 [Syzygium grande]